jgi:lysine N-acyltransferase
MSEAEAILPRELPDLSAEVGDVPPPPMPEVPAPYAFRLADPDSDAEMIAEWMSRAARWQRYLRAQLGGDYSRPFVASYQMRV